MIITGSDENSRFIGFVRGDSAVMSWDRRPVSTDRAKTTPGARWGRRAAIRLSRCVIG